MAHRRTMVTGAEGMLGRALLETLGPDVVINCAAYTNVDGAESDRETAFRVNAVGAGNVARSAAQVGARLVHMSTDYVFDGLADTPYVESAQTGPTSVYGLSKLAGEQEVLSASEDALIVRTAWLYGRGGGNFVETVLRLSDEGGPLRIVDDQTGSPTYAADLALVLRDLAVTDVRGIVHATNSGTCTWFEFAAEILRVFGRGGVDVIPIATEDIERPAPRPRYSVLSLEKLGSLLGWTPRPWNEALLDYVARRDT